MEKYLNGSLLPLPKIQQNVPAARNPMTEGVVIFLLGVLSGFFVIASVL